MPGDISRQYKGPKDGSIPSWMDKPSRPTLSLSERRIYKSAKDLVRRFEMESMALHKIQREWLEREIAKLLAASVS